MSKPTVYYWAPAPNRHLDPLLAELRSLGILAHEYYGKNALRWTQLGTGSTGSPQVRTILPKVKRGVVRELVRSTNAHAFHLVHGMRDLSALATTELARAGRRYFVMIESPLPRAGLSPRRLLRDAYYRKQLKGAAGAFAVGRLAAEALSSYGVPTTRIAPAAYPVPFFEPDAQTGADSRRIVFCGRAVPRKGLHQLAHALAILRCAKVSFDFEFVGAGPELISFIGELESSGVPYTNHGGLSTPEVFRVMTGAAMVVVPSLFWEGWGYVVNEGIACGSPVVVSSIAGASELVVPGLTGLVFPAGDVVALREAIRAQLNVNLNDELSRRKGLEELRRATGPSEIAHHLVSSMRAMADGHALPEAPWHRAVRSRGGNSATDWWSAFSGDCAAPTLRQVPSQDLRRI